MPGAAPWAQPKTAARRTRGSARLTAPLIQSSRSNRYHPAAASPSATNDDRARLSSDAPEDAFFGGSAARVVGGRQSAGERSARRARRPQAGMRTRPDGASWRHHRGGARRRAAHALVDRLERFGHARPTVLAADRLARPPADLGAVRGLPQQVGDGLGQGGRVPLRHEPRRWPSVATAPMPPPRVATSGVPDAMISSTVFGSPSTLPASS